jgi:hypothetical protein
MSKETAMRKLRITLLLGCLVALTAVALHAAEPASRGELDRGKRRAEIGTEKLVAGTATPTPPAKSEFVNPKVEPGKVKWHASLADACKASKLSGRPVLVFHMMGKLDDQFC